MLNDQRLARDARAAPAVPAKAELDADRGGGGLRGILVRASLGGAAVRLGGAACAFAVGALLDGIPESIAIGLSILHGGTVSIATVVAIFLSNLPEGLASSDGMRRAGRPAAYVFGVWGAIAVACGLSSLVGYLAFDGVSPAIVAGTTALAAGAMLTMIVDTMIPESVEGTGSRAGIFAVLGFLFSFALSQSAG